MNIGDVVRLYCEKCDEDESMTLFGTVIGKNKKNNYYSLQCKTCERFNFYSQAVVEQMYKRQNGK